MTDAEIDNLWLEAFKASSDDGKVRQRFAELCYQKGAAEVKPAQEFPLVQHKHGNAAIAAMDKACDFPVNTCSASRHAAQIAEHLIRIGQHNGDPTHCGESIALTVESLWKARTEIDSLRTRLREALRAMN